VNLDKLFPLSSQLVPTGAYVLDGAVTNLVALHPDSGDNVALQHLLQLLLVSHQLVERVHWNLIKSSICRSEDSEGSGTSEVLHHAGGLQGGVEGGEVLVLSDQGGHALPGLVDGGRGLGGVAGDGVDVGSAEVVSRVGTGRTDWEVVVETTDGAGVVRENSLGCQEWVEIHLDWSALLRRRPPQRLERPQRSLDRSLAVVDGMVNGLDGLDGLDRLDGLDGLYNRLSGVMSMLRLWLGMMGSMCGMLSMVGSMGGMFSRLMTMVVVMMIVTISRGQGEDH